MRVELLTLPRDYLRRTRHLWERTNARVSVISLVRRNSLISRAKAATVSALSSITRRSANFREAAAAAGVELLHTRPCRPQTNGKAERFIRILQNEWAYARAYRSNAERLRSLPRWLYRYNHRRPHGGISGAVPASRL